MRTITGWRMTSVMRVALLLAAVAAGMWLWTNRVDASRISQEELHRLATCSDCATMDAHVSPREVVIEPVQSKDYLRVIASYLPPPIGSGGQAEMQGMYDADEDRILITGRMARLQAGLPEERLQIVFIRTLRHEYGHAFMRDWLKENGVDEQEPFLAYTEEGGPVEDTDYPKTLRPVVDEYKQVAPMNLYGFPYLTSTFDEYMAESYSRYVSGEDVPPETLKFFSELDAK
jgi:hypothetical protein